MSEKTTIQIKKETRDKINIIIDKYPKIRQDSLIEFMANTVLMNEGIFKIDFENRIFKFKD